MVRVTTPRVDSQMARQKTCHQRSGEISRIQQAVSSRAYTEQRSLKMKGGSYSCSQNHSKFKYLSRKDRQWRQTLASHHGVIPLWRYGSSLVETKVGSSMKTTFQICNLNVPSSIKNTCIFAAFREADTITNLRVALDRYEEKVNRIEFNMEIKMSNCLQLMTQY